MNVIKNILFISYIKNNGLRRLAFVISCFCAVYFLYILFSGIHPTNEHYKNLEEMQTNIRVSYETNAPYWYKKQECAIIYLEKYGLSAIDTVTFLVSKNIATWCELYPKKCPILSTIKDKSIHLECRGWGDEHKIPFESICIIALFFVFVFYLPFIFLCILKLIISIIKWIYAGFMEK